MQFFRFAPGPWILSALLLFWLFTESVAQTVTSPKLLHESEIYKFWVDGAAANYFTVQTKDHTELLSVFTTDLRSSNADGHGAYATAEHYGTNINATINFTNPNTGAGFLSIVYTFDHPIKLIPGIPQHVISRTHPVWFQVEASSDTKVLTISLTPFQGRPMAYISTSNDIDPADESTYQYVIHSHINIPVEEVTTFYIRTENMHDHPHSRFYITVSEYTTNILLQSGVPRQDDIEYAVDTFKRWYYFNVTEENCHLALMLTVIQGDPDLFVSTTEQYPDANTHELSSETSGSDSVTVRNATKGVYWVGIQSVDQENVSYSVSALMECSHEKYFMYLMDGMPQMGLLGSKEWAYYQFEFNYQHDINQILIQVNPSNGDPDLYVDVDVNIDINNVSCTDPKQWRFNSTQYGSDHIRLIPSDFQSICDSDPEGDDFCTIDVAVFGWTSTVYTVMVSTNSMASNLINGKPSMGYITYPEPSSDDPPPVVDPVFTYYQFDIENMNHLLYQNNITISITPLVQTTSDNSIETVFYVDGDLNPTPNEGAFKWKSSDLQHPYLIIDGREGILNDDTVKNELYIAVTSNQNLTFSIILTVGALIQLQDGQYQVGHVSWFDVNHYELIIDGADKQNQDIEVLLNIYHGNVNLYVSSQGVPDPYNPESYEFYNNQTGSSIKRLIINNTLVHADPSITCNDDLCRFYITVASNDWDMAEYTITASTDTAVIPLLDGLPVSSQINADQYEYFSIEVDYDYKWEPALFIEATSISGHVDLYVSNESTNHRPNSTRYTLKSEGMEEDSIYIDIAQQTTYYIAVHAVEERSTFTVSATMSNSLNPGFQRLLSGVPARGTISTYHTSGRFYQIYVPDKATILRVHVEHALWDVNVYVTRNVTNGVPGSNNSEFYFKSGTLEIPNPGEGSWFLGLYSRYLCYYTLTATLSDDMLLLQDGQSINGQVARKRYDYYALQIHDVTKDLTISLTCFSGDADLYVALSNGTGLVRPSSTADRTWMSMSYGSDLMTISHDDPKSCNQSTVDCTYIIGVFGYSASLYSITATTQSTIALLDGVPIQGECGRGQWNYYRFQAANEPTEFVVSLTVVSGQQDLYMDLGREPTAYQWTEYRGAWNQDKNIEIHHTSCAQSGGGMTPPPGTGDDVPESCTYFIGIRGVEDGRYSISFQTVRPDTQYMLEDGVPVTREVGAQETLYYKYSIMETLKRVTFAITPVAGNPECYISSTTETPSDLDYDYKCSNTTAADWISIPDVANGTTYYIAMYSETEATFTLSAIGEHYDRSNFSTGLLLTEGNIQSGSAMAGEWAYYSILPSATETADIIISVYAISGDPDIFCNTEIYPTMDRYEYVADFRGPETLIIPNINGTYFCGIHADHNVSTSFYIVAYHSHSIVNLLDDIPVIGELNEQNDVNYYHFVAESLEMVGENDVISIIFSPIYASTSCSILVSHGSDPRTETEWDYSLTKEVNDGRHGLDLKIKKRDLMATDDWYITIKPAQDMETGMSALYTILLSYDNVTTLQEGLPQNGQIDDSSPVSYYIWNVDLSFDEINKPLSIGVSLLSGNCQMYISRNSQLLNSCDHGIGCPLGLFQEQTSCSAEGPFVIHPDDELLYVESGTYYIAITDTRDSEGGNIDDTYYNIAVYTAYSILYLTNGQPTWDYIEAEQYRYYDLFCNDDHIESLDVVITPSDLDTIPFLLAGIISPTRPRATLPLKDGEWELEWIEGHGAVSTKAASDPSFVKSQQYWISLHAVPSEEFYANGDDLAGERRRVLGDVDSMIYTISATVTSTDVVEYRALIDGMPQMAILHGTDTMRYYSFKAENAWRVGFTVTVAQGKVSLYVSTNGEIPSLENQIKKLEQIGEDNPGQAEVKHPCSDCSYLMVVIAESESIYSILAASVPKGSGKGGKSKSHPVLYGFITVLVLVIVGGLGWIGFNNWKKKRALEEELEVAELQLNLKGKMSMRQHREELESTNPKPARPFSASPEVMKKKKKKYGKKYAELDNESMTFSAAHDAVLVPPTTPDDSDDDDDEVSKSEEPMIAL